ncbi:MAG: cyclophilin-like fold protein [Candidatus Hadarchaeales archaeon]
MKRREIIKITSESGVEILCEIRFDKNPKTAEALMRAIPFETRAELWGKEVYFEVPFRIALENADETVNLGDVAYWPDGPSLCLFFGPTPLSPSSKVIKPYSPVNVIGRIIGDLRILEKVREGEKLEVERVP